MDKKLLFVAGIISGVMQFITPLPVKAAVNIGNIYGPASSFPTVGSLMSVLLSNAVVGAGILLLFFMIAAGIGIIMSAGSGDAKKVETGRKAAAAAIIGFAVVFAAYWILQILGVITGVNILGGAGL